jgi:hypothetical protein
MSNTPLNDTIPLEEVQLESDLTYEEKPINILGTTKRNTRTKTIKFLQGTLGSSHGGRSHLGA